MHHVDANKIHEEKARWELRKNATSCFEQILIVKPHKKAAVWPLTSYLTDHPRHVRHCWRSKNELLIVISNGPRHMNTLVVTELQIYIHQLCVDNGCSLDYLPGAMDDRCTIHSPDLQNWSLTIRCSFMSHP